MCKSCENCNKYFAVQVFHTGEWNGLKKSWIFFKPVTKKYANLEFRTQKLSIIEWCVFIGNKSEVLLTCNIDLLRVRYCNRGLLMVLNENHTKIDCPNKCVGNSELVTQQLQKSWNGLKNLSIFYKPLTIRM